MTNDGIATLNRFKIDHSTKSSRQAEYIIRCSMLEVRCSTFISFYSLIRLDARGQRQRSCETSKND